MYNLTYSVMTDNLFRLRKTCSIHSEKHPKRLTFLYVGQSSEGHGRLWYLLAIDSIQPVNIYNQLMDVFVSY